MLPLSGGGKVNVPKINGVIRSVRAASRRLSLCGPRIAIRTGDIVYIDANGYEGYATAWGVGDGELVFTPLVTIWDPASVALSRVSWHGARTRRGPKENV